LFPGSEVGDRGDFPEKHRGQADWGNAPPQHAELEWGLLYTNLRETRQPDHPGVSGLVSPVMLKDAAAAVTADC
jgi:hypothetical protein